MTMTTTGVTALFSLQCFNTVGCLTGGYTSHKKPMPLTSKGSLLEYVKEENEGENLLNQVHLEDGH